MSLLDTLLKKHVVLVTGKGGTGKTTVCAALGLAAAARGLRTTLVETSGATRLAELFGLPPQVLAVRAIRPSLRVLTLTSEACVEDFVVKRVRFRSLYRLVFRNRVMGPFMDSVPGLPDLIQLGKVYDMQRESDDNGDPVHDLIIVDAPATGHGLTMLSSPETLMDMTLAGPLHANSKLVRDLFTDPANTALLLTSLPEALPLNETIDLFHALGPKQSLVAGCVLNRVLEVPFTSGLAWPLVAKHLEALSDPRIQEALHWTSLWLERTALQEQALESLSREIPRPIAIFPFIMHNYKDPESLETLGDRLDTLKWPPQASPAPRWMKS